MPGQSKTEKQVHDLIEDCIVSMNLDLLEVEYIKEDSEWILRIIIDKPGGISLDDCSDVSLAIDPILDQADIMRNPYNLEVSSPGIDRPLTTDRDFERNIGQLVEVHPVRVTGGKQWTEGILKYVEEDRIGIILDEPFVKGVKPRTNGQEKCFMRQDIRLVKKAIRF